MDESILRDLGFTEREVKTYLALLELGSTTVGPVAKLTKLPHTKVYQTLDRLADKGLVSHTVVSRTKHFQPADPKEILNMIDEKRNRFLDVLKELELRKELTKSRQVAVVHEGFRSLKALINNVVDTIQPGSMYWAFTLKQEMRITSPVLFIRNIHMRLNEKGVDDRVIAHTSVRASVLKGYKNIDGIKIRFIEDDVPAGIVLIEGKVITIVWGTKPTAIEVTSNQIHDEYKQFFLQQWEKGKE